MTEPGWKVYEEPMPPHDELTWESDPPYRIAKDKDGRVRMVVNMNAIAKVDIEP